MAVTNHFNIICLLNFSFGKSEIIKYNIKLTFLIISICSSLNTFSQNRKTIDSLKQIIKTAKNDTVKINAYVKWDDLIYMQSPDTSKLLNQEIIKLAEKFLSSNQPKNVQKTVSIKLAASLNNIGYLYDNQGNIPKAIEYYCKSLNIYEQIGDKKGIATSQNNIGYVYNNQGDIPMALEYFGKSLKINEEIGNKKGMAYLLTNIGSIYENQDDIPKAIEYYTKSLKIGEEIDDKKGMGFTLNNIGLIYYNQAGKALLRKDIIGRDSLIKISLYYYNRSLNIREQIGDKKGMATTYSNIGLIYKIMDNIPKTIEYYNKGLEIRKEIGDKKGMAYSLVFIGSLCLIQNNVIKATNYSNKAYRLSKEMGFPDNIERSAGLLKRIYEKQGDYKKAFEFYQEEILMRDSISNEENHKKTQKQQARYEYEKKAATDSVANAKAMQIKELELSRTQKEKEKQKVVIYSFVVGFVIILVFLIIIFRLFLQKKKANIIIAKKNVSLEIAYSEISTQKEEITAQRDEIEAQRDKLSEQNSLLYEQKKEITDSINYAKRIQQAVLPTGEYANNILGEHFILFKPKDIVSGDFYWGTRVNEWLIVTVADCTGHGVPGAFMSMLGVSFLNEIVRKKEITKASEVLDHLRISIIDALQQKGHSGEQTDGMDIALCVLNTTNNQLQFAGANNPLYISSSSVSLSVVEDKEENTSTPPSVTPKLLEIKGDKQPVSIYKNMTPYTNHQVQLKKGDCIFLFSDGYEDQFGGPKNRKFMTKQLKELFLYIADKSMKEQSDILETTFSNWKGNNEQIDDITILGFKI